MKKTPNAQRRTPNAEGQHFATPLIPNFDVQRSAFGVRRLPSPLA
jgi:hypothetical protein